MQSFTARRLNIFTLATVCSFAMPISQSYACGEEKAETYSEVPLSFDKYSSNLNALGLKMKPDPKYGWVIQDGDGAQMFFNISAAGSSEPCIRLDSKGEPYCGAAIKKLMSPGKDGKANILALKDSNGSAVGELKVTSGPRAALFIAPYDKDGNIHPGKQIKITDATANLDNKNYKASIQLEATSDWKTVADIKAERPMVSGDDGGLKNPPSLHRCIEIIGDKPAYAPMEMAGVQVVSGTGNGLVKDVRTPKGADLSNGKIAKSSGQQKISD